MPLRNFQDKSFATSVHSKPRIAHGMCSVLLPGVANRSELTSAVAIHVSLWKNISDTCDQPVLVTGHLSHVILLNPQSRNCVEL